MLHTIDAPSVVQPRLRAGDVLLYDYRVVHRGPANPGPQDRPLFYSVWAGAASRGDANFPRRSLAELEQRTRLFGLRGGFASAPAPWLAVASGASAVAVAARARAVVRASVADHPAHATARRAYDVGDVIAVHHAFQLADGARDDAEAPTGDAPSGAGSAAPLRGFFRTLPCDESQRVAHLGPALLEPSAAPSCYLAPSADGGQTRRLLALTPLAAGDALTVPFGFAVDEPPLQQRVRAALASAEGAGAEGVDDDAYVADLGDGRGRGVFARRAYAAGALVAEWPCVMVPDADVPAGLRDYVYTSPKGGTSLVVLGHGLLYNHHSARPNLGWSVPTDAGLLLTGVGSVRFVARRAIAPGDELLATYGDAYWRDRGIEPL